MAGRAPAVTGAARTVVIHPELAEPSGDGRSREARLEEIVGLARAIDLDIRHAESRRLRKAAPGTYFGRGMVETIGAVVAAEDAGLVVVDAPLSPVQQRNLERAWGCKVIDRIALILEIFGQRARTREGRLQVELAHLTYQRSRLVRSWTHLERQRGGFGFLGGPGESQLEIDRRLIDDRLVRIKRELETVKRRRALHRRARRRVPLSVVALVGYTNAGKSTLFNRLTEADVLAEDMLFATLDPTMRAITLPSGRRAILSDTVGFISDLPTQLVAAFHATLEEVIDAELVVHVRDIAHPDSAAQKADVIAVLVSLGLEERMATGGIIEALNKIDLLEAPQQAAIMARAARSNEIAIPVSALTGEGTASLLRAIDDSLGAGHEIRDYDVSPSDGASIAWLYEHGEVLDRRDGKDTVHLRVRLDADLAARYERRAATQQH